MWSRLLVIVANPSYMYSIGSDSKGSKGKVHGGRIP